MVVNQRDGPHDEYVSRPQSDIVQPVPYEVAEGLRTIVVAFTSDQTIRTVLTNRNPSATPVRTNAIVVRPSPHGNVAQRVRR